MVHPDPASNQKHIKLVPRLKANAPAGSTSTAANPPIHLKLTPGLLASLREAGSQHSKITLTLNNDSNVASFNFNGSVFEGSILSEQACVEAYLPDPAGSYINYGRIRSKISLRRKSSSPPLTNGKQLASTTNHTQLRPEQSRILHILALGLITPGSLSNRASASLDAVKAVLSEYADTKGSDMYTLKPTCYQLLQISDYKHYTAWEKKKVAELASKAYDSLKYANDHPARQQLRSILDNKADTSNTRVKKLKNGSGLAKSPVKASSTDPAKNRIPPTTKSEPAAKHSDSVTHNKLNAGTQPPKTDSKTDSKPGSKPGPKPDSIPGRITATKRKRPEDDEDMHDLARRFKQNYAEYLQLYSTLAERKSRPLSQVQKLLKMHRELEKWKQTLWRSARRNKSVV